MGFTPLLVQFRRSRLFFKTEGHSYLAYHDAIRNGAMERTLDVKEDFLSKKV